MKRSVKRVLGIFFVMMLTTTFGAQLIPKAGISEAVAAQKLQNTIRSEKEINMKYDNSFVQPDFKVERVFVSEANAPDVPISMLTVGGQYVLNCDVLYTGANVGIGNCAAGTIANLLFKIDGNVLYDQNACLVPNQKQIEHSHLTPMMNAKAFSVGTHKYECLFNSLSSDEDSNPFNNVKSMTYTVK